MATLIRERFIYFFFVRRRRAVGGRGVVLILPVSLNALYVVLKFGCK